MAKRIAPPRSGKHETQSLLTDGADKDTKKVGVPTGNYNTFGLTYSVKANTVWNKKTQRWEQKDEY